MADPRFEALGAACDSLIDDLGHSVSETFCEDVTSLERLHDQLASSVDRLAALFRQTLEELAEQPLTKEAD